MQFITFNAALRHNENQLQDTTILKGREYLHATVWN